MEIAHFWRWEGKGQSAVASALSFTRASLALPFQGHKLIKSPDSSQPFYRKKDILHSWLVKKKPSIKILHILSAHKMKRLLFTFHTHKKCEVFNFHVELVSTRKNRFPFYSKRTITAVTTDIASQIFLQ